MSSSVSQDYEAVIGLEVHVQLATESKLFCACRARMLPGKSVADEIPNINTCPVCSGQPGSLPVINKKAVQYALMVGLATDCEINPRSIFARKNYFYPDLPKGYQISQYEEPLCREGHLVIKDESDANKKIRINRIHIEEDAGKSVHYGDHSVVNLNRACVPLVEIVTEPDFRNSTEAGNYLRKLYGIVTHLGVCDGNLQEGNFRCDANISVRPRGSKELGKRTEIKNINSFRFVEKAIDYEISRQIEWVKAGQSIVQETRNYDSDKNVTTSSRSKEEAHDYRYFPDPDLVPLMIDEDWIAKLKESLPELPEQLQARMEKDYAISSADAALIVSQPEKLKLFREVMASTRDPKAAARLLGTWLNGEISRLIKEDDKELSASQLKPDHLIDLLPLAIEGALSSSGIKRVISLAWESGADVNTIVEKEGLKQVSDSSALEPIVDEVIQNSPEQVAEFKAGKDKLMGYFVGQAMKASQGQGNPQIFQKMFRQKL